MSIWFTGTVEFKEGTRNSLGIVEKKARELKLDFEAEHYRESFIKDMGGTKIEIRVCNPRYELMHRLCKELVENPNKLVVSVKVRTFYIQGEE